MKGPWLRYGSELHYYLEIAFNELFDGMMIGFSPKMIFWWIFKPTSSKLPLIYHCWILPLLVKQNPNRYSHAKQILWPSKAYHSINRLPSWRLMVFNTAFHIYWSQSRLQFYTISFPLLRSSLVFQEALWKLSSLSNFASVFLFIQRWHLKKPNIYLQEQFQFVKEPEHIHIYKSITLHFCYVAQFWSG